MASAANSAVDSVISSSSRSGASPDSSSASATSSLNPSSARCRAEMLTCTRRSSGQAAASVQARCSTQAPSLEVSRLFSAASRKAAGREQPAGRVLPADERLVAEQRLVAQVHDRLVEEPQLLVVQRVPQVGLQLQGVDVAVAERALVHLDAGPAAVGLGPGERALRLAQQVVGGHVGAEGEADAGRQGDLALVHEERLVEDAEQPVGQRAQPVEVLDVLGDDEELVGAEPDGGVLDPGAPAQPVGDLAEQQVAGLVAEGLVDGLEPVDVQVHQADLQPAAAGQRDGVPQPVGERAAVGQPGERVGEGAADQVVLGPAAVGDVDQREDDELRLAVVVPDDLVRLDDPQLGAVGPAQPPLAVEQQVRVELRARPGRRRGRGRRPAGRRGGRAGRRAGRRAPPPSARSARTSSGSRPARGRRGRRGPSGSARRGTAPGTAGRGRRAGCRWPACAARRRRRARRRASAAPRRREGSPAQGHASERQSDGT